VLVEMKVKSLGLDRASNTPVVILQEEDGERVLPIWIGLSEASAIARQLADMKFSRPLTHDLIVSVVDNTYYAELVMRRNGETISVDARPSDSIAVALRMEADIYADDSLLDHTSIEIAEDESVAGGFETQSPSSPGGGREEEGATSEMAPEELKEHLRKLNPEDFGRFTP